LFLDLLRRLSKSEKSKSLGGFHLIILRRQSISINRYGIEIEIGVYGMGVIYGVVVEATERKMCRRKGIPKRVRPLLRPAEMRNITMTSSLYRHGLAGYH